MKSELGDLLFQVVFYAQLAREEGAFEFSDVAAEITEKMIRRHPHVFGDTEYANIIEQKKAWEEIKDAERNDSAGGVLDHVPLALPGLSRALKLQRKAARVGFDWSEPAPVIEKIKEELDEIQGELVPPAQKDRLAEEMGDLLFACANLARHLDVDPEAALRLANKKFERRFRYIEAELRVAGRTPQQATLAELDELWERAKVTERHGETAAKPLQR